MAATDGCGWRLLAAWMPTAGWRRGCGPVRQARSEGGLRSDGQLVPSWAAASLMQPSRSARAKARSPRRGRPGSGWLSACPAAGRAKAPLVAVGDGSTSVRRWLTAWPDSTLSQSRRRSQWVVASFPRQPVAPPPPSWSAHPELVSESNVPQPMESHGSATVVAMGYLLRYAGRPPTRSGTRTEHFTERQVSTLLRPRRSGATWENGLPHSGSLVVC
jgi:hypothetical protein